MFWCGCSLVKSSRCTKTNSHAASHRKCWPGAPQLNQISIFLPSFLIACYVSSTARSHRPPRSNNILNGSVLHVRRRRHRVHRNRRHGTGRPTPWSSTAHTKRNEPLLRTALAAFATQRAQPHIRPTRTTHSHEA